MRCKECNMQMSPEEVDEILTKLEDGEKPERICQDCIDYITETEREIDLTRNNNQN